MSRPPPRSTLFPTRRSSDLPVLAALADQPDQRIRAEVELVDVEAGRLGDARPDVDERSEEHTSELQSHVNLVCRLLPEKKKMIERGRAVAVLVGLHYPGTGA